eukprot:755825-Hanusia_phi.AAC.2
MNLTAKGYRIITFFFGIMDWKHDWNEVRGGTGEQDEGEGDEEDEIVLSAGGSSSRREEGGGRREEGGKMEEAVQRDYLHLLLMFLQIFLVLRLPGRGLLARKP